MSEQAEIQVLDDALVAEYLRRNPDFFLQQNDLLASLRIPHARGSAVSLVERQLEVLRQRGMDLRTRLTRLLEIARDNDRLFAQTRKLTLDLLVARSLPELVASLEDGLRNDFRVPFVSLIFIGEQQLPVGRSASMASLQQQVPGLLSSEPLCGVLRQNELEFLLGAQAAPQVRSAAVVSVEHQQKLALLALGSKDAREYDSGVDTLFLDYVAQVLARLLPELLAGADA